MSEFDQGCRQKAWVAGAAAGVVVALFVIAVAHLGVMAGLFLGVITFLLLGGFLVWAFCTGSDIGLAPPRAMTRAVMPEPVAPEPAPEPAPAPAATTEPVAAAPVAEAPGPAPSAAAAEPPSSPQPAMAAALPADAAVAETQGPLTAKTGTPKTETAKTAKAKADKPKADKPKADKPKAEKAKAEKAKAEKAPAKAKGPAKDGKPRGLKAPRKGGPDDLTLIEGIGPKLQEKLNDWGIYHFDQIAGWGEAEIAYADENVPRFKGRCSRDKWVAQAKIIVTEGRDRFLERAKTNDY